MVQTRVQFSRNPRAEGTLDHSLGFQPQVIVIRVSNPVGTNSYIPSAFLPSIPGFPHAKNSVPLLRLISSDSTQRAPPRVPRESITSKFPLGFFALLD